MGLVIYFLHSFMVSQAFLTVDDQPITLARALPYLQTAGKLKPFIADVVRQYVMEQELQTRQDLDVNPALIETEEVASLHTRPLAKVDGCLQTEV